MAARREVAHREADHRGVAHRAAAHQGVAPRAAARPGVKAGWPHCLPAVGSQGVYRQAAGWMLQEPRCPVAPAASLRLGRLRQTVSQGRRPIRSDQPAARTPRWSVALGAYRPPRSTAPYRPARRFPAQRCRSTRQTPVYPRQPVWRRRGGVPGGTSARLTPATSRRPVDGRCPAVLPTSCPLAIC